MIPFVIGANGGELIIKILKIRKPTIHDNQISRIKGDVHILPPMDAGSAALIGYQQHVFSGAEGHTVWGRLTLQWNKSPEQASDGAAGN